MSIQKNIYKQVLLFILMLSFFSIALLMGVTFSSKNKQINQLSTENLLLLSQVERIEVQYDSIMRSNAMSPLDDNSELDIGTVSIEDSPNIIDLQGTPKTTQAIKNRISFLKNEIKASNEQLVDIKTKLSEDRSDLSNLLAIHSESKIESKDLTIHNVSSRGVKIVSNIYARNNEKKIQQIRVCFSIEENEFTPPGNKDFYIQVVNPRNQVISVENSSLEKENLNLKYSALVDADYRNSDLDVCTYVDLEPSKTYKGKYQINIYHNFKKISTSYFDYE